MSLDLRFHPLAAWPIASTSAYDRRSRLTFKASWPQTLSLLEDELDKLNAKDIVIEAVLRREDIRIDGWPRANANPSHPGIILSFASKHGPLRYLTDRHEFWQHNVRAIALGLGALRAVDRYGITQRGEQYVGWKAIPQTTSTEGPIVLLSRVADIPLALDGGTDTKTLYRQALKKAHPDHGGSRELLEHVQDAGRKLGVA